MQDVTDMDTTETRRAAIRQALSLGFAVGISGLAFGATAVTSGLTVWQACALSLLAFTGASQFALAGVIASGGNLLAGTAGALLLSGRNALYGLRLAGVLGERGPRRLLAAQGVIDETTAIAVGQPDRGAARAGFWTSFATLYVLWNLTTLIGALGTGSLADPAALGLDVVAPAAFLAILWPRLAESWRARWTALAGVVIALAATPFLPSGVPVLLAAAAAVGATVLGGEGTK
ncbi:AzlC family ABC transporter permease [Longispora albida]|uniref:AzlC family ABC transporter permease n=1 Tax=Longispora albida TaxID=203523 RepID=UPI001B7FD3B0|nr:AzlC family ABC transporter permease [Longispora albida]